VIDATRRWDFTQQHTGQHLLSGVFEELFGWKTVSVHFGDAICTLELGTPGASPNQLKKAEERANVLVTENRPVTVTFEEADVVAPRLRKAPDRTGTLRIVTIADLDTSACGGTHVRATGEIGPILLRRVEKVRANVRVEFLCGQRAVRRARADFDALSDMAARLSAGVDELAPLVAAQGDEAKALASANKKLLEEVCAHRARALWSETASGPDGVRRLRTPDGISAEELRAMAAAAAALPATLLVGAIKASRTICVAVSADLDGNAGALLKGELQKHEGRGGGSPRTAQGTVPHDAQVALVMDALLATPLNRVS
jgi:alanyl-tRNA synthetase